MRLAFVTLILSLAVSAEARLGETAIQFADRYGAPKDNSLTAITDKQFPLTSGDVHIVK